MQLAEGLEKLRRESDRAIGEANNRINQLQGQRSDHENRVDLIDIRNMDPGTFSGSERESWRQWSKRVKAYCNARTPGFRAALDWAEAETVPITEDSLKVLAWAPVSTANSKLYDLLIMKLMDDPLIQAENHLGQGFEAWRSLASRYDPVGEMFTFDKMTSLMHRERCKSMNELPAALERWTRDLQQYEKKSGKSLQEDMRAPIIFQMIPEKNYADIKLRWKQNKDKDIKKFIVELIDYANELRFEQPRGIGKGPSPMDVDALAKEQPKPPEEPWPVDPNYPYDPNDPYAGYYYPVDWMGKAGKKGGGKGTWGGKGGKAGMEKGGKWGKGGKSSGCHWCGKEGHRKADCREFAKWKQDKDEERKKAGLPPYRPGATRGASAAAVDPEGHPDQGGDQDYVGFGGFDAGSLEAGIDALCTACDDEDYDSDDYAEEWIPVNATKFGASRTPPSCQAGCGCHAEHPNQFQALMDEGDSEDPIDMLEEDVMQYADQDPWATSRPTESLAEKFARERKELLESFRTSVKEETKPSATPPGIPAPDKGITQHKPSINLATSSRPLAQDSVGTQTEVHLEHSIRAVTWIPVVDQLEPVHDVDEHYAEDIIEGRRLCDEAQSLEPVNDIFKEPHIGSESGEQIENFEKMGDVNDVDSVEVYVPGFAEVKADSNKVVELFIVYVFIMHIAMLYIVFNTVNPVGGKKIGTELSVLNLESEQRASGRAMSERASEQNSRASIREKIQKNMKLKMKRGITLDSGSHHNVMPKRLVNQKKIRPSAGSKIGMHYVAANKGKIPNEGEIDFNFTTEEGNEESWCFQIAEVNKALGAIADRVDNNFRVVFDKDFKTGLDSSYMLNKNTNKVTKSTRIGNVWVINAIVNIEDVGSQIFGRLG